MMSMHAKRSVVSLCTLSSGGSYNFQLNIVSNTDAVRRRIQ